METYQAVFLMPCSNYPAQLSGQPALEATNYSDSHQTSYIAYIQYCETEMLQHWRTFWAPREGRDKRVKYVLNRGFDG